MCMSVARNSTARSRRSLSARTTGAPLARSRKLSTSSSSRPSDVALSPEAVALSSSRAVSAVAISSNEATAIDRGAPSTSSAARTAAVSVGSATTMRTCPASPAQGKTQDSRRNRGENLAVFGVRGHEVGKADPRQGKKSGDLVGIFARRYFGLLPQFMQWFPHALRFADIEPVSPTASQQLLLLQVFVEFLQLLAAARHVAPMNITFRTCDDIRHTFEPAGKFFP